MRSVLKIILAVFFICSSNALAPASESGQALTLFVQGNAAYQGGKYDEAIADYESIAARHVVSGPVFYNLGNAYFKKQQLGKAIVNYERARQLMPRDSDLESNYRFALLQVQKFNEESGPNRFEKLLNGALNFYSADEWAWAVLLWLIAAAALHLVCLWLRWNTILRRWAVGGLILVWLSHGALFMLKLDREKRVAIAVVNTRALFEPREGSTAHFDVVEGGRLEILKAEGEWAKVRRPDGKMGWIQRGTVEKI